jgi:hypothetical protein
MKRAVMVFPKVFFALVLLTALTTSPGMAAVQAASAPSTQLADVIFFPIVTTDPTTPPQSPQQIVYTNLQQEVYGQLTIYFNQATTYRDHFLTFMYSQQLLNRDTTTLQGVLDNFDSYYSQAETGLHDAKAAVGGDPGLDLSGNVTNPDQYNTSVHAALNADWTARNFLNLAVYQLHSGLLQYQYIWGPDVGIPDIPKWHLTPYQLP